MKDLETMQGEGREGFAEGCTPMNISDPPSDHEWINTFLDQHTANTWNEARETLLVDMKRAMKGWSGTGTAIIKDYETLARDYD